MSKVYNGYKANHKHFMGFVFIFFCLGVYTITSSGQSIDKSKVSTLHKSFQSIYNLNTNLINGREYYNKYSKASGHPFFMDDQFKKGKVILNGITYDNINIKYDIVHQQIILYFTYLYGGYNQIILDNDHITEFEIDGKLFKKLSFDKTGLRFFQVLQVDHITYLMARDKKLELQKSSMEGAYSYSSEKIKTYLLIHDQLYEFKGKKSFARIFPKESQQDIKKYIRSHKIRFRSARDQTIIQLIRYCSQFSNQSKNGSQI